MVGLYLYHAESLKLLFALRYQFDMFSFRFPVVERYNQLFKDDNNL